MHTHYYNRPAGGAEQGWAKNHHKELPNERPNTQLVAVFISATNYTAAKSTNDFK